MNAKSKALYVIHRNVRNKYRHATDRHLWAITFAIYDKVTKNKPERRLK